MAPVLSTVTGPVGAVDDLHHAEVGKRGVRLPVARVDDDALGTVGDADLGAGDGAAATDREHDAGERIASIGVGDEAEGNWYYPPARA